jgi:hypothetical protein
MKSALTRGSSGFSNFDFRFSLAKDGPSRKSWVSRFVDFLLGPSTSPHPIYIVGAAAGFTEGSPQDEPRVRKARPYVGDQTDSAYFALAQSGMASYGASPPSQEYVNGRR